MLYCIQHCGKRSNASGVESVPFGEKTRPSANDHIATGIGGTFVGEALFRMASLLLEHGGETPGFWRELGAAMLSPPTGFNDTLRRRRGPRVRSSSRPAAASTPAARPRCRSAPRSSQSSSSTTATTSPAICTVKHGGG